MGEVNGVRVIADRVIEDATIEGASSGSERFYSELAAFDAFEGFADFEAYAPVPQDWVVLAGDIRGSTQAIAEGRYKAVNMVGAAVITAVLNACGGADLPYVFGGDGGFVLVPGSQAGAGTAALRQLQAHSGRVFGLSLRAAAVPIARLRAEGHDLHLRRLRLNGTNCLAMVAGTGLERVDTILKGAADPAILAPAPDDAPPDLEGLSCRWQPLVASRGRMIALMVRPVRDESDAWRDLVRGLTGILGSIPAHAPVSERTLRLRWPPTGLLPEARAAARGGAVLRPLAAALFTSLVQLWCHRRGSRAGGYDAPRYLREIKAQTDFRKFDGCLRVVLDCSPEQVAEIERWLESEYRAGRLVWGLHEDRAALMTCLVFSLAQSEHVHFVDAAGGGFARAAEGFKRRLRALGDPPGRLHRPAQPGTGARSGRAGRASAQHRRIVTDG
jgi:Protein of unknown function (DUF3095)